MSTDNMKKDIFKEVAINTTSLNNKLQQYEDILSEDLDKPNWHIKYARNIINLIVFIGLAISINELIIRGESSFNRFLSQTDAILLFVISAIVGLVCMFFDTILDQESTAVRWFNHARFWLVFLSILFLTLYIAIKVMGSVTV